MVICPACGERFQAPPSLAPAPVALAAPAEAPAAEGSLVAQRILIASGVVIGLAILSGALWMWAGYRPAPASPVPSPLPVRVAPGTRPATRTAVVQPAPPPSATLRPTTTVAATAPASQPATVPAATAPATTEAATSPATVPTAIATRPATTTAAVPRIVPVRPPPARPDLDDRIGVAIDRGASYLLTRFRNGRLPEVSNGDGPAAGADALAVYALLISAQAIDRPDLAESQPAVGRMLDLLRGMPMLQNYTTYDRSLRVAALSVYNRRADRGALKADALFLEGQSHSGAYTYDPLPRGPVGGGGGPMDQLRPGLPANAWDNSNSQYGALGVWLALDAGVEVPSRFWEGVRQHWVATQLRNGQWGYAGMMPEPRLTMTVAGITTLLVAEDQLGAQASVGPAGRSPFTAPVAKGLDWLEAGNHAVTLPDDWPTYALYGIERAALASGYKTFGSHDWYRELAARELPLQQRDGAWVDSGDRLIDTAFVLLFLSRGRHPILMDKLRFDGSWANRPQDVAHLARFASKQLERPLNWQVVSADDDWPDWMDAPVLYLASHEPPRLTGVQVDRLRSYAQNGGLILTSNDGASAPFDKFVADLSAKLFPQYPLRDLPLTHPIYRSLFPLDKASPPPPLLRGVSNGSRLLLVHCPTDLGRTWQLRETVTRPVPFQLGLNVFIYGAGKGPFRNKLRTPYLPEPQVTPVATVGVARVAYAGGDGDPEPAAAGRFARAFLGETSIRAAVTSVDAADLDARATPLALLTGTGALRLSDKQAKAIHDFVAAGGVLLVDACGGSPTTASDVRSDLLPRAFPHVTFTDLPRDHPIMTGTDPGMSPVDLRLRSFAAERAGGRRQPVQGAAVGRGVVLFSSADVTTGLLGTSTWAVDGYEPDTAYGLVRNALLFAVERWDGPGPTTR